MGPTDCWKLARKLLASIRMLMLPRVNYSYSQWCVFYEVKEYTNARMLEYSKQCCRTANKTEYSFISVHCCYSLWVL